MIKWVFRVFDILRGSRLFEIIWHILTKVSTLNETEIKEASKVLGSSAIRYDAVRVAEGRAYHLSSKSIRGERSPPSIPSIFPSLEVNQGCISTSLYMS